MTTQVKPGTLFSDAEAADLFDAQRLLMQRMDDGALSGRDLSLAEVAERALRELVNRDADRQAGKPVSA